MKYKRMFLTHEGRLVMKIAVLTGGTSTERDVSIVTSTNVCGALRKRGHNANMIDVFFGSDGFEDADTFFNADNDLDKEAERLHKLSAKVKDAVAERKSDNGMFFGPNVLDYCKKADIVFMGLHGENGENGKIQAAFDLLGIKYTGPGFLSSAISMDKSLTKKVIMPAGVPMPKGTELTKEERGKTVDIPLPLVVKPACGGSSVGVSIVYTHEELNNALDKAFELEDKLVIEEYIKGREFSVGVMGGKALPIVEIIPNGGVYDFEHKYDPNGAIEICPAELDEETTEKMQHIAELACKSAGIRTVSRVDELIKEDGSIYALEINTLPGMTPTSLLPKEAAAIGMSYEELCEKLIEISLDNIDKDKF